MMFPIGYMVVHLTRVQTCWRVGIYLKVSHVPVERCMQVCHAIWILHMCRCWLRLPSCSKFSTKCPRSWQCQKFSQEGKRDLLPFSPFNKGKFLYPHLFHNLSPSRFNMLHVCYRDGMIYKMLFRQCRERIFASHLVELKHDGQGFFRCCLGLTRTNCTY